MAPGERDDPPDKLSVIYGIQRVRDRAPGPAPTGAPDRWSAVMESLGSG